MIVQGGKCMGEPLQIGSSLFGEAGYESHRFRSVLISDGEEFPGAIKESLLP